MRILAIVSGDYGELSMARYFLEGLSLASTPLMLVPATLGQSEGLEGDVEVRIYSCWADIARTLDESQPDTVLLFSGYLLRLSRRFSMMRALRLYRSLRRRGVRIITSDPFIGLVRSPSSVNFREMLPRGKGLIADLILAVIAPLLAARTYLLHLALRGDLHIYPAPVMHRYLTSDHRGRAFYNATAALAAENEARLTPATPTWLFVLSRIDFQYQSNRYGESFPLHVNARLRDATRPGRRIVMIGPEILLKHLREQFKNTKGIDLHGMESYGDYMRLLLRAERVFFWNYYSFSVLHRVLANQPVHFFDEGHSASIVPALKEVGVETFYGGWRPPLLNVMQVLDEEQLKCQALEITSRFVQIKEGMAKGYSPRALLEELAATDVRPLNV